MIKNPKLGKHSHNNRESIEGTALRLIRESRKYSLKDVAEKMNVKVADIDHFENGRKFYTPQDIEKFLLCYDFSPQNFKELLELKVLSKQLVNHFILKIQH
ncbi:MAG: helix-turn-helix domain-containing protein [Bacteriovorax sp.]